MKGSETGSSETTPRPEVVKEEVGTEDEEEEEVKEFGKLDIK